MWRGLGHWYSTVLAVSLIILICQVALDSRAYLLTVLQAGIEDAEGGATAQQWRFAFSRDRAQSEWNLQTWCPRRYQQVN